MASNPGLSGRPIKATRSCTLCKNHSQIAEKGHKCEYDTFEHKADCKECKESSKIASTSPYFSNKIKCVEKSIIDQKAVTSGDVQFIKIQEANEVAVPVKTSEGSDSSMPSCSTSASQKEPVELQPVLVIEQPTDANVVLNNNTFAGAPANVENHEQPVDPIQEPIVEDTAQLSVPLWPLPLPPSGKIENRNDQFENEPHFGIHQNTTELLSPTKTTLVPFGHPLIAFSDQNIEDFFYHVVDKYPELTAPGIKTCTVAKGKMMIISADGNSTNLIRSRLEKLAYRPDGRSKQVPILVLPNDEIPSRIILSCTFNGFKAWDKFLASVGSDGFDGSFWKFNEADHDLLMNKYKIKFSVDGVSFYQLFQNNFTMRIDGESVNVEVEVNPFENDMNNFAGANNGEM